VSRVAVLKGGRSLERQVSLRSGARVEDALHRLGHEVAGIDVGHDLVERLRESPQPDVAFIALHGRDGEDGTVQEMLEVLGIPYTGSGIASCIRSWDKVLAKHEMRAAGIPTPDFYAFGETAFKELGAAAVLGAIEERLDFPIVVKPAAQGSALGINVPTALVAAFSYDQKVLLERHVEGRDLAVSIVENDGEAQVLPVVEAVPADVTGGPEALPAERGAKPPYDFEARYSIGQTEFVVPAEIGGELTERAQALALEVWRLFGCAGFSRVDLMLDSASEELYVLETNPIPGLTETSLLPQAAEAAGVGFDEVIDRIVRSALR
jgi:D-alanine-D-alanine ligase